MDDIRVFISYSSKDSAMAGSLSTVLNTLRVKTFLAHDDINVGAQWKDAVRKGICECDMLVALVTPNFRRSEYTDQEVGAAWGLGKPLLPVLVDREAPAGFITERQGMEYNSKNPPTTACLIFRFVLSEIYGEECVVDMLVERLAKSESLMESQHLAFLLTAEQLNNAPAGYPDGVLTPAHVESIRSTVLSNARVNKSNLALMYLDAAIRMPELFKTDAS